MAKLYFNAINDKTKTMDDVPQKWKEATQALLDADEKEKKK